MTFISRVTHWYTHWKKVHKEEKQTYEEEIRLDTLQFISEHVAGLRHETDLLHRILNASDVYSLGLPPELSSESYNPWWKPDYRIRQNNKALAAWNHTLANQTHFTQRIGEWWVAEFFRTYSSFTNAVTELEKRETEREKREQ